MLDLKDINLLSLEYFPFSKSLNLKDGRELVQKGIDKYGNPVFEVEEGRIYCTIQLSKNGNWYIAFLKVKSEDGFSFFKSFILNDQNDTILFDKFKEWVKEESTGRWVKKREEEEY